MDTSESFQVPLCVSQSGEFQRRFNRSINVLCQGTYLFVESLIINFHFFPLYQNHPVHEMHPFYCPLQNTHNSKLKIKKRLTNNIHTVAEYEGAHNKSRRQGERQKKKVLFRNSQFLMALHFCSNSLLLKSTVQLLRVSTERKRGREKKKKALDI